MRLIKYFLLLIYFCSYFTHSQNILINEFLASNVVTYPEMHDFDDYTDWIELYNSDSTSYSLEGYFLTDDLSNPSKWRVPDGAIIDAEGYLIIWADDYNNGPGATFIRPYWPWADYTTRHYHTNFKLSKEGEQIGLFRGEQTNTITLIQEGSSWKYLDDGSNQSSDWTLFEYDDNSWSTGNAELGYGDGDEETEVSFGPDENNKYITTYFRHIFSVDDPDNIQILTIRLKRDDGAVVYLNGSEILRTNMPDGTISYDTHASSVVSGSDEDEFFEWTISENDIINSQNVFAVELHQISETSSDISFDLELIGVGYANIEMVDTVTFGAQLTDVSFGRTTEGSDWYFFGEPTPGNPNNTPPTIITNVSEQVSVSLESGFYSGVQYLELSTSSETGQIFYTLDGSRPGTDTNFYTSQITIDITTVLRARSIEEGKLPGEIITATYFIDEQNFIPTVSLIAEPETLWDDDIGIYENEYKQREIPVTIQYFTSDGERGFTANAGARLGGLNIWTKPQKPFTIYSRDRFGQDLISYQIFENKQIANFSRIVFRNGGDDWEETLIRDPMTESLVSGMIDCGYMAYTPSSLYLNGTYWGIHNIREKFDSQYFYENFNVNPENIDQLEYTQTQSGTQLMVIEGSIDHYSTMVDYILNNNLNDPIVYNQIRQWMNVDSFIDHILMTLYCANTSWGHNREWWRSREEDGQWQWLIVDIDRGFNVNNSYTNLLDNLMDGYELFQYLLNSQLFRDRFIQRSAAHLSNTFLPERINSIVDSLSSKIYEEMSRHVERWGDEGGISSMGHWEDELNKIKQFSENRHIIVQNQFIDELNLDDTVQITVVVDPPGSGRILINDVPVIQEGGEGTYFKNKPISILAQPIPGYQFVGWVGVTDSMQINYNCITDSLFLAGFQISDEIILPDVIADNTLLTSEQPYAVVQDLVISPGVNLTISEGVEIRMAEAGNIIVEGQFIINGTEENPVQIIPHGSNGSVRWGAVSFDNDTDTSTISHLRLVGASTGEDPMLHQGAISSIGSHVILDHVEIENVEFPIYAEGGSIILKNSSIACDYICDFINVKGGDALIENSIFYGSDAEDTDAIDLDNVTNGIIRKNRIYNFTGYNSDGIDIGENSENILIDSNLIFHSGDKGISVGIGSSVILDRNLIVGCKNGVAIKDNSVAYVVNNTFFYNDTALSCYEKNEGEGGATAEIVNTIFSSSLSLSIYADQLSEISVNYSLSDSEMINGEGNLFFDPLFIDQAVYNLELKPDSPCIDAGSPEFPIDEDGSTADMGAYYIYDPGDYPFEIPDMFIPQLKINEILSTNDTTNTDESGEYDDWLELYNAGDEPAELGGLYLTDDSDNLTKWMVPEGTEIEPQGFILFWCDEDQDQGELHTNFKLSSGGEFLGLVGIDGATILDSITFGDQSADVSYGRVFDGGTNWDFLSPTPGTANSSSGTEISVSHAGDWNLIGLPLYSEDTYYQYLFPESISGTLYSFNGTYILEESLIEGNGYWLRFYDAGSTIITGTPINEITINLNEGWNLISGISGTVDVASISDPGSIVVPGTVYGFTGTYSNTSVISPGQGYWLRTYEPGEITLINGQLAKTTSIDLSLKGKANYLTVNGAELYFGIELSDVERLSYSLPPKPPEGAFDVRFKEGSKVVNDYGEIEVMSSSESLIIVYDIQIDAGDQYNWILRPEDGEGYVLQNTGEIVIQSSERYILEKESALPETFSLYQNFPNPFNPITTLRYDLPEQAFVSLIIYDMLGREVTQLVNTSQTAGFKSVKWNATDSMERPVSAGVYLYQIQAGAFVQTKKMVLLK